MSTGHYHSSCTVMIRFPDGGSMEVVVAGDAPVDPVVEEFVGGEGGTCKEYPRSVYGSTGRTIWLPVPLDRVAVIVELATVLDGLPGRHNFKRNHYFYEAPKAARFLRAYHQTLGG